MKIPALSILLFFNIFLCYSQEAYIGDELLVTLKNVKNDQEKIRIVVLMKDQVDLAMLLQQYEVEKTPLGIRQKNILRLLKEKSAISQAGLVQTIENYYGQKNMGTPEIRSCWIVNMMVANLPAALIWQLRNRDDIARLDLDKAWMTVPVQPYEKRNMNVKMPGAAETGLIAIKANEMWKKGYTGKNRISYSVDTGVWPDHPAISDRFLANYFPYQQCWFPYDSEFPADKTGSHGTHTLGTTLGLDPATHDTIGVAFNAYWICSDPVATSLATVKPLSDFMFAYEWALNPDGDTSTFMDIPDVINNSWGYDVATDTLLCDSYVSQMFLAVEAAGIANVFSAGNDGPGPMTISVPHHLNTNEVNSFTVGALDGNQPSFPIAAFSGRGPSICGGSGSLLIKPEVSAPGVNVRSCVGHDSYDYYSGTSMAGPHVTGAVLLLKEAFPFLPGNEILKALYYSATDLGDPGEDNTYGMGMIDLAEAFDYLDSLYTPVPPDSNAFDAAITDISFPQSTFVCDSAVSPEIMLLNNSLIPVTAGVFKVHLSDGPENLIPWAGNLLSGQSQTVVLPSQTIGSGGFFELSVFFETDTSFHETSLINNHRMARFQSRQKANLPFIEDFENGIDSLKWYIGNPNNNLTWDTMSAGGLLNSQVSGVMQFNQSLPSNQIDELVTPSFNFSAMDSVFLSFDVAYQNVHQVLTDSLKISLSVDCGLTFPAWIYRKGGQQLQTYDTLTPGFIPWRADQWRHEIIEITDYAGNPDVLIKFTGHNKRGNNLFIDNIKIYTGSEPVLAGQLTPSGGKIWPNPSFGKLNVLMPDRAGDHLLLLVCDLFGRVCFSQEAAGNNGTITLDISGLPEGVYFLKLIDEKTVQAYKFIRLK